MATLIGKIENSQLKGWELCEDQEPWITLVFPLWERPHRDRALKEIEKALKLEPWLKVLSGVWKIDIELFAQAFISYLPEQIVDNLRRLAGPCRAYIDTTPSYDNHYPPVLGVYKEKIPVWVKIVIDEDQLYMDDLKIDRIFARGEIASIIKTDSNLDAFMMDHFPEIFRHISKGMDRVAKVNTLIESVEPRRVIEELLTFCKSPHRSYESEIVDELSCRLACASSHQSTPREPS